LLANNSAPECVGEPDNSSVQGIIPGLQKLEYSKRNISASLVPLERLGGFIIACQMLLGIPSNLKSGDESSQSLPNFGDNEYPLASLYPLPPAQRAIIACEQSRCYARQDTQVSSVNRPACYKSITLDTSTKRMRIVPVEEEIQESQRMDGIRFASTQSSFQVPVSQYPQDNVPGAKGIESLAALLANQPEHESDQEKSEVIQGVELQESATNKLVRAEETVNAVMPGKDMDDWEHKKSGGLELKKSFTIGVVLTDHERMVVDAGTLDGTKLIQAVVNDTLDGYILWGYRLALEKDPQIVISLQCLLVACNIVRHIIEGCPIESCLGMSNTFQNYREGVEFLMLLMAAVKEGFDREGLSLDSATSITVNSNDNVQMQPLGFTKHNLKRKLEEEACFVNNEALVSHICDSALYICCILEKPWCWDAALKHRLISHTQIPIIAAEVPLISATEMDVSLKADDGTNLECTDEDVHLQDGLLWTQQSEKLSTQTRSSTYVSGTSTVRHQLYRAKESLNFSLEEESILSAILRAESLREIESLVLKVKKEDQDCSMEADLELENSKTTISRMQLSSPPTTSFYRKWEEISGRSAFRSIFKIGQFAAKETHSEVVNMSVDVAAILRCQAFHALSSRRQSTVAKKLYKLAFATDSKERDSLVMLWLLEHANPARQEQGVVGIKSLSGRKKLERSDCDVPRNFGLLKYTLLYLVEKELWDDLAELCQWGTSLLKDLSGMEEKSRERKGFNEGAGNKGKATSGHIRHKRFAQTLKVAKTLGELIQLCTSLQVCLPGQCSNCMVTTC
jgi:phage gp36-like protein